MTIACGSGKLGNVYGGAKNAHITGDVTLNINGGQIDNVFGGNNVSGAIDGKITVNIDIADCSGAYIKNVYGGGNQAPYSAPPATPNYPEVNLISGTVGVSSDATSGNVFGGGLGASATVTGNPLVNLVGNSSESKT